MATAIKQSVTIQPGGVVQVISPELPAGARAEVTVVVEEPRHPSARPRRFLASFIGSAKGQFRSVEEIDAYIRELRDEWDR